MRKVLQPAIVLLIVAASVGLGAMILRTRPAVAASHAEEAVGGDEEPAKGPHGGRLLGERSFQVELTIYEPDIPPQSRVYVYQDGKPLDPGKVKLAVELHRFGGRVDRVGYRPEGDYLAGDRVIEEPHSFVVKVTAEHAGQTHRWSYDSFEGRVEMPPGAIQTAGIVSARAGPGTLRDTLRLQGRIAPNADRLAQVMPRFPGVVKEARKRLGDPVAKDETIAVIESNQSLQAYPIRAQMAGTVIRRGAVLGEFVGEKDALYTVADLRTVWADLSVRREDFPKLREGQTVEIEHGNGGGKVRAEVIYLSAFGAEATQTLLARAEVPNADGAFRPGLFVTGEVVVEEKEAPVVVKASALQKFGDRDVVFMREGNVFQAAILELGRRDGDLVEVVHGLAAGTEYVVENSFVVKADVMKSGASHEH